MFLLKVDGADNGNLNPIIERLNDITQPGIFNNFFSILKILKIVRITIVNVSLIVTAKERSI